MTSRGKFHIPSLDEMNTVDSSNFEAKSLFLQHKEQKKSTTKEKTTPNINPSDAPKINPSDRTHVTALPTIAGPKPKFNFSRGTNNRNANTFSQSKSATKKLVNETPVNGERSTVKLKTSATLSEVQEVELKADDEGVGRLSGPSESPSGPSEVPDNLATPSAYDSKSQSGSAVTTRSPQRPDISHVTTATGSPQKVGIPLTTAATGSPQRQGITPLIVSTRQRGNPLLKNIRNVIWEFGDIVADYVMGKTACALFLSLRYHALNPNYIHERLKQLGSTFELRVLLVQVDVKDPQHSLQSLAEICILADCTLMLAWTAEEAGRYLETYKSYEHKPPDLIMEKTDTNFMGRVTDALTSVKRINKTDAMTLMSNFKSLEKTLLAEEDALALCPGFGPLKAKKLHSVFHESFVKSRKRAQPEAAVEPSPGTSSDAENPKKKRKS